MPRRTAAITGVGAVGPGFEDVGGLTQLVSSGEIPATQIERFWLRGFRSRFAFQNEAYRPGPIPPNLVAVFGRKALEEAWFDAMLPDRVDRESIAVFGTAVASSWDMEETFGSLSSFNGVVAARGEGARAGDAVSFTHPAQVVFQGRIARHPTVVATGCTAGLDALGYAWTRIQSGVQRAVVVASDAPITPMVVGCFEQIRALTDERTNPCEASAPFTRTRSGFCIGEGAAALVLEDLEVARRRGARPRAILRGYASTSSAFHMTAIRNSGEDIARAMDQALKVAGVRAADVDLLSAHATGTPQNDVAEYNAFQKIWPELERVPVFAGKAHFGHALGASNLIETVATVALMKHGFAPAYPRRNQREIEFERLWLPESEVQLSRGVAVKNSSGFSGSHCAVVLEVA